MLDLLETRSIEREIDGPAGREFRPADWHAVAILATTPALRAGLDSMVNRTGDIRTLSSSELGGGAAPDVVLVESRAWDQVGELTERWPGAAVLFVGEPSAEA
ncbi:MAG: hypothetical protein M3Y37_11120, partial [Chloroflexota bacterium]|nr:hypothetical protein [Chloroflexota bacterium]